VALPVDLPAVADPENEVTFVGAGVDDSVVPYPEAVQSLELPPEGHSFAAPREERLLDPCQDAEFLSAA